MDMTLVQQRLHNCLEGARALAARDEFRVLSRLLAVGVAAVVALGSKSLFGQLSAVGRPAPGWLGFATAAETASLLAYVLMARQLSRLGGFSAPVRGLVRPTLAGIAMGASLPAGVGASNVYWYKTLRRYGADRGAAALVLTGTSVAGAISLFGLLAIGIVIAGNRGPLAHVHFWLLCIAAVALVLRLAFAHRLGGLLVHTLRRIAPTLEPRAGVRAHRLRMIMILSYANWLLDCIALFGSLQATHASVPAQSVVLVYVLAQLVANVALLPGGGGTVELSLAAGFAAFGHHSGSVLAGALLYRFIACWGLIPLGWLAFVLDPTRVKNRSSYSATTRTFWRVGSAAPSTNPPASRASEAHRRT